MSKSMQNIKVYDEAGEYVASCKYIAHGLMLAASMGGMTEIRIGHFYYGDQTVWMQGAERPELQDSYDLASIEIQKRWRAIGVKLRTRL
jgi:hypothetical protein